MPSKSKKSDDLDLAWNEKPEVILKFIKNRPQYEQLCSEVAYILTTRLDEKDIEYSAVSNRAKTLNSFSEKLTRKDYENPLENVTDLAGVRVVYLYKEDRAKIEQIIEAEFNILEKIDKVEEQDADKFGYGALHYLVNLGRKSSGARYDDLKKLVCEIQVRTVLQDAWAIIDHHLVYKQESDVPKILRRKLNSLSGLFETADDQFNRIRDERESYKGTVKDKLQDIDKFLSQEINLDTLAEFLKWKFPKLPVDGGKGHVSRVLPIITSTSKTLSGLNEIIGRTEKARSSISEDFPPTNAAGELMRAISLVNKDLSPKFSPEIVDAIEKHRPLIP